MFKKLKDRIRDKTREEMYNHLVRLGLDAELVERGAPEDLGKTSLFTPFKGVASDVGSIQIIGKDIDVIQIARYTGDWGATDYEIDYAVKGQVKGREERVTAKTNLKTRGFLRKQVVDLKWIGGEIAELLNEDQPLKESILTEQIGNIEIKPDRKKPYVRIHTSGKFPSEKTFKCYNTVAKHIRTLLQ